MSSWSELETLDRFMVEGQPDWELFEQAVGGICGQLRGRVGRGGIDRFGRDFELPKLQALLGVHTHLLAGPTTMLSSVGAARQ
jgi:hypothetical protein